MLVVSRVCYWELKTVVQLVAMSAEATAVQSVVLMVPSKVVQMVGQMVVRLVERLVAHLAEM